MLTGPWYYVQICYFPTFSPCLYISSATLPPTPKLFHFLYQLPNSSWPRLWCQGQQHLHLLELLKYEESHSYPDFLTQHQIWTRPPSKELSLPYSVWWLITHDFHETFFDSLKLSSWITQTPLVSEHETLESSVSLTTLQIHIYILQIMPLHYNLRLCDSTAFLCIFSVSLSSLQAVLILLQPSPHQPPAGTGGISHRFSPAWT